MLQRRVCFPLPLYAAKDVQAWKASKRKPRLFQVDRALLLAPAHERSIIISKPCCFVCVFCWPYELLFLLLCCFALATRDSPYYLKLVLCRFNRFHPVMLSLVCMFGGRAPVAEARHIGFDSRPPTPTLGPVCLSASG